MVSWGPEAFSGLFSSSGREGTPKPDRRGPGLSLGFPESPARALGTPVAMSPHLSPTSIPSVDFRLLGGWGLRVGVSGG